MSCMSCTHACALSWHLQLMSLASPAESGMTIILERLCISPTEAIRQGDRPYMQQGVMRHDYLGYLIVRLHAVIFITT
jgi:hypothetical protein